MKKKQIWNKTNTILLGIMICVIAGIGQKNTLPSSEKNEKETEDTQEDVETDSILTEEKMEKSVVHVTADDYMGSGLVLTKTEEEIVIATSRHLTDMAQTMTVRWCGMEYAAYLIGSSDQYDVAFLAVDRQPVIQEPEAVRLPQTEEEWLESTYLGTDVRQYSDAQSKEMHTGYIVDKSFVEEFYCELLKTNCHARAGMSGGGVFSEDGMLLGMIIGGVTPLEAEETYSLSAWTVRQEYEKLSQQ